MEGTADSSFNGSFLPYGYSYLWEPSLVWLNAISGLLLTIGILGMAITIGTLLYKHRSQITYSWVITLFTIFLGLSGLVELLELIGIWNPFFYLEGIAKLLCAAFAIAIAILLFPLLPTAFMEHSERSQSMPRKSNEGDEQPSEKEKAE